MKPLFLSFIAIAVAGAAACSSSSDPTPEPTDAGADATPVDSGGDAQHPVTACASTPSIMCGMTQVGTPTDGCSFSATSCEDGHKHSAECDGQGNCVCSVDSVPTCTCSTGVPTCDGGTCACGTDGYCCFTTGGVKQP